MGPFLIQMQNLNPGIVEWFGLERTLKNIWFQPPAMHLSPDQIAPPTWPSAFQCWGSHSFSEVIFLPPFSSFYLLPSRFWDGNMKISLVSSASLQNSFSTHLHSWPTLLMLNLNSHKDLIQQMWGELEIFFINPFILIHGKYYMQWFLGIVLIVNTWKRFYSWIFRNMICIGDDIFSSWHWIPRLLI